jgi:uncharacterized damage-inducible protein DinB
MNKAYFLELANYNIWANNKVITWLNEITKTQYEQSIVSSFGSIAGNALHVASAEKIWLERLRENAAPVWIASEFKGDREALIAIWQEASENIKTFIENFDEKNLNNTIKFKRLNGEENELPFYQIFSHVLNHSTFHRGQFITLLRQVGFSNMSGTDLLDFYKL